MRMIYLERRKPLDCHQRPLHHTFPQQRHLRRGVGIFNSLRTLLPTPSHYPRNYRSFLSSVQESQNFDMGRKCPTILEPPFGDAFFPSIFDHLRPRRDLSQIRQARMDQANSHPPPLKSPTAPRHQQPSPSCRIIPIEVKDTDAPKSEDPEEKNAEDDCVIQIADDEPCLPSDVNMKLGRKTLFQGKSQLKIEDDNSSDSCVELTTLKPVQTLNHASSGASKGKETLIGGANKCHLPPDEAVLVLDDIGVDSSSLGQHHKDLAQCQGTSSLDEEVEVGGAPDYPVYMALKKKLSKECRQVDYIRGDGNCFFRAVSKQLYGSERYHKTIRNLIVDLIATNKNSFAQFVDGEDVQEHVERMCQEQSWATTCEIYAAATLLQRDIFMLTPDHLNEIYSWLLFKPIFQCDAQESGITNHPCYLTMCNTNGNHYDRIVPEHGGCNCFLPHPELDGVSYSVDLTEDS